MKYTIEISEKQAEIIKIALEEYFRLRMNQTWDFADDICFEGFDYGNHTKEDFNERIERRNIFLDELRILLNVVHPLQFRGGKFREQTIEMRRAQDIWQVIRHKLYLELNMEGIFPSNMGGNMNAVKEDVEKLVKKELESANQRFPMFRSDHEGYAVIKEEIEESEQALESTKVYLNLLWIGVKGNLVHERNIKYLKRYAEDLACEAIQVAAMAQKFIDSKKEREKSEGN